MDIVNYTKEGPFGKMWQGDQEPATKVTAFLNTFFKFIACLKTEWALENRIQDFVFQVNVYYDAVKKKTKKEPIKIKSL